MPETEPVRDTKRVEHCPYARRECHHCDDPHDIAPPCYSTQNSLESAYLDGLVLARDILWLNGDNSMLRLLEHRMRSRYNIELWSLRSPVPGDNPPHRA